jgi:hypothetical protein
MDREEALALLERAPTVHVDSTTKDGQPILSTVRGAVADGLWRFTAFRFERRRKRSGATR